MEFPLTVLWTLVYLNAMVWVAGLGGNDGWGYYANLETLIDDRDFMVADNAHAWAEDGHPYGLVTRDDNAYRLGGASVYYPWGHSLVYAVPFVVGGWVADFTGIEIDTTSLPKDNLYYGQPAKVLFRTMTMVGWSNLLTLLLVTVLYRMARKLGSTPWLAVFVVLAAWWASPLPFYANNALSHAGSALFVALMMWQFLKERPDVAAAGLFAGLAALMRTNNALIIFPALWLAWRQCRWSGMLSTGLTFTCVFSLNFVNWYLMTGNAFDPGYDLNRIEGFPFPVWHVTLDPRGGWFMWYPAALGAAFMMVRDAKRRRRWGPWLLMSAIWFLLMSMREEYHGAGGYGPRYLCPLVIAFLPGFVELVKSSKGRLLMTVGIVMSTFMYTVYCAKIVSLDVQTVVEGVTIGTNEPGRHILNFLAIFDYSLRDWPGLIIDGSRTLPKLLANPLLLITALLPAAALLHIGYWWSRPVTGSRLVFRERTAVESESQ